MTWTKEKQKIYIKQYKIDNKEKIALDSKIRYDKIKHTPEFKQNKLQRQREYRKKERQKYVVNGWRNKGIIDSDWDSFYDVFIKQTHCWICNKKYDFKKYRRCLDHDHETGEIRYIVCNVCNIHIVG
jgi:hypothetical protein